MFPKPIYSRIRQLHMDFEKKNLQEADCLSKVQDLFIAESSKKYLTIKTSNIMGAGLGVFAVQDIPPLIEIGIFYGYENQSDASKYAAAHEPANSFTNKIYDEFKKNPVIYVTNSLNLSTVQQSN